MSNILVTKVLIKPMTLYRSIPSFEDGFVQPKAFSGGKAPDVRDKRGRPIALDENTIFAVGFKQFNQAIEHLNYEPEILCN